MTDAFAELVMPIFRNGIVLQEQLARGEPRTVDQVKRTASAWIEEARRRSLSDARLKRSYELARFGLVAWIDESLTDSEWGRKVGSPEEILEWDHFASRDRATLFYAHAARAEEETDMDALEAYLLAVTLGFKGELLYDDPGLADWVHHVYDLVSRANAVPDRPFAEEAVRQEGFQTLQGSSLLLTVSVLVAITAIVTLIGYLVAVKVDYDGKHPLDTTARAVGRGWGNDATGRSGQPVCWHA